MSKDREALRKHFIPAEASVIQALRQMNSFAVDLILLVVDAEERLVGTLTDGDIRRALVAGHTLETPVSDIMRREFRFLKAGEFSVRDLVNLRSRDELLHLFPIVDAAGRAVEMLNFRVTRSRLPMDVLIMAGGEGRRLRPLTDSTPKPLLKIGDKPIIDYGIDRFRFYGIRRLLVAVRHLAEQIEAHLGAGSSRGLSIDYIRESSPMGTIGALGLACDRLRHEVVLVANSDILVDLDLEDMYLEFQDKQADLLVATVPYKVSIPYAILETEDSQVLSFKEKPEVTYYSNGGIYMLRRPVVDWIPEGQAFDATDLMERLCGSPDHKVVSYPVRGYWLDIGSPEDFRKAQEDVKRIGIHHD